MLIKPKSLLDNYPPTNIFFKTTKGVWNFKEIRTMSKGKVIPFMYPNDWLILHRSHKLLFMFRQTPTSYFEHDVDSIINNYGFYLPKDDVWFSTLTEAFIYDASKYDDEKELFQ